MSVIANITIQTADFPLGRAFRSQPDLTVHLERAIPLGERIIPYIRVSNESLEEIKAGLSEVVEAESITVVDEIGDEALVRMEWPESTNGILGGVIDAGGVLLEAYGRGETWHLELRFDTHRDLTAFYRYCADHDIRISLDSVHNPGIPNHLGLDFTLTETQRETLLMALERGYFDVPRQVTLRDLGEELGISDAAVSQRLRRGLATVIEASVPEHDERPKSDRTSGRWSTTSSTSADTDGESGE
ncbi:MAG: helix-turn-helix domain-containing protein [Halalkalicoccus sp.]